MLTGRESLARLVGKRRPNLLLSRSHLLLLAPPDEVPRTADPVLDWATCPVCRIRVRGSDPEVNAHLDLCLARGTKRKLTQSTLLQFCQKPKSNTGLDESGTIKADFRKSDSDENNASSVDPFLLDSGLCDSSCEQNIVPQLEWHLPIIAENDVILEENLGLLDGGNPPCSSSIISSNDVHEPRISNAKDTFPKTLLETVVVGHRYHNKNQLSEGAAFLVVRDHENAKDKNALKVLSYESGEMLGYLPKDLAKHLSLLIDKYHFKLEGSVTSMPKHDLDGVPVQLLCERMVPWSEMDVHDVENVKSLLENALQVVGLEKAFAPNMTKYQKNFHIMIQEVLKRHDHLFTDTEKSFLEYFGNLSDDSQRLLIRLYTRKGPWFRASNISYAEVQDSNKAIEDLQLAGYICSFLSTRNSSESAISEVLDLLTVVELREIACLVFSKEGTKFTRKKELVDTLSAAYVDGTCKLMENLVTERAGTCIKISSAAESLLWRIQRLFFLNGEQDLSSFLLVDLGMVKYPSYMCNVSKAIFRDRDDFLKYEEAIAIGQIMDESVEQNDGEMVNRCLHFSDGCISPALDSSTFLSCFSASWVYSKVVTLGVSFCERERRYEDAVKFLRRLLKRISCGGKRGYWTLRLSIDLEHMGYTNESLSVAEEGMGDPWVRAGSRVALQRRILRLGRPPRRWKVPSFAESINRKIKEVHIRGRPLNCETGMKNRYYGYDGAQCGVEELALQYYAGEGGGWKGTHAEGGIWLTIFGLLMWDIIFSDVPDVFQTKFQTSPLDLGTDSFYLSRKELIESQLLKIQDGMAEEILICSWETHFEKACRGVKWDRHPLEDLRAIVSCNNGHCLASLCRHLSQDYRSWSSGLPDLLLWCLYEDGRGGEAKLVEVKGPRDRLSEQQRAWILILMDCGFDVEVCRVSSHPSPNKIHLPCIGNE